MRPPCRAETAVTSVILYKTEGRAREGEKRSIVGNGMRSKVEGRENGREEEEDDDDEEAAAAAEGSIERERSQ